MLETLASGHGPTDRDRSITLLRSPPPASRYPPTARGRAFSSHGRSTSRTRNSRPSPQRARSRCSGQAPKAVSQANAEELLSKRVYTDPGHFLVELLQNAEDAGRGAVFGFSFDAATGSWCGTTVKPFDTRDVVGVTSIGQTTKRKQQIGFFGVGFKSVYEVTDRPQIYSDVYRFEIADVSIPKSLSSRPADVPEDGTVLVLPLRDPDDAERSPAALFRKARDLDAIVLFTLRRIDVIELDLIDAHGAVTRHAVHELPPDERGISRIRQEPEGWVRGYAVHDVEHVYHGGGRAPGRADRSRVMVGLRVDETGIPRPLEEDTPTIYSYLPTEEHSGLRWFVQGHFDVPVDRERITQDSRWNEWILSKVPAGLAALAQQLIEGHDAEQQVRVAEGLLCVLPLTSELGSPIFRRIVMGLRPAFASMSLVPCDNGSLYPPGSTLVADEALAALFEGEAVRTTEGERHLVLQQLDPRAVESAQHVATATLVSAHATLTDLCRIDSEVAVGFEDADAPAGSSHRYAARMAIRAGSIIESRIEAGALLAANLIGGAWEAADRPRLAATAAVDTTASHSAKNSTEAKRVGSTRSSVYHRLTCRHATRIKPGNRVEFAGLAAARAARRRPCKTCKPGTP